MALPFAATIPGTPLGVRTVRREMSAIAADCGMDAAGIADVRLAVTEAATNAVMHAYAEDSGELTVTAAMEDGGLTIVIGDTGPGLVERPDSPGLGAGLSVIATIAERLRIVSTPGGTKVHMAFPCPPAPETRAEEARMAAVRRYDVLDTPPDGAFERLTALAAKHFDVPIAIVSIVDSDRIWFKSHHGMGCASTPALR